MKKAPPLPGMADHPEPADLGKLALLPIPELVETLRQYGVEGHAGIDRSKLLVFLMHSADNNQTIIHTINERKFKHKSAFFPLCQFGQFCLKNVSFTRTYRAAVRLTVTYLL